MKVDVSIIMFDIIGSRGFGAGDAPVTKAKHNVIEIASRVNDLSKHFQIFCLHECTKRKHKTSKDTYICCYRENNCVKAHNCVKALN